MRKKLKFHADETKSNCGDIIADIGKSLIFVG